MLQAAEIFQDGMILQRKKEVKIWGKSGAGDVITAEIQGKKGRTTADENGDWCVTLPELAASERETLVIENGDERLEFHEVAVGEVWLAGGQSNMAFWMRYEKHIKEERKNLVRNPKIRFYDVPENYFEGQRKDSDYSQMAVWRMVSQEDLDYFSAVGYYFEKKLAEELNVPVGIIGCNMGGTTASAWMKQETVARVGKPWMEDYLKEIEHKDMDAYWKLQHELPANWRGRPFEEPLNEFLLPQTPTAEEEKEFYEKTRIVWEEMYPDMIAHTIPGCLYEYMLKEIAPFAVKGVLWYQGESDDVQGKNVIYKDMLAALIEDWRALWKEELPFLVVQIAAWEKCLNNDCGSLGYEIIRACQKEVADTVSGVYLCSISDAGERYDIHPKDKKIVGERLALLAEGHVYGRDILCDAPDAVQFEREGAGITVTFDHAPGGLSVKGSEINALEIYAGGQKLPFTARTEDNRLEITLEKETEETVELRFAQTRWFQVNLYNRAGIPAIPFRAAL